MHSSAEYRAKALEFLAHAATTSHVGFREQLVNIALAYTKLADLAERNARSDLVYEPPPSGPMGS